MFLKPFRIKTQTSVKSSDRKKLRTDIRNQYPALSDDDVLALVPNKEEMLQTKVSTHGDEHVLVYNVGRNPIFYDIFKQLYPTVYTLWRYPELLPSFRTWPPVFEKLLKGADLMLPGVIPDHQPSPKMFGNLQKGDLVTIKVAGNRAPLALGKAMLSGEDMYMSALRGKGIQVLHILGDQLWDFGDKSQPPNMPEAVPGKNQETKDGAEEGESNTESPNIGDLQLEDNKTNTKVGTVEVISNNSPPAAEGSSEPPNEVGASGAKDGQVGEEEEERDPVAEMDSLLHFCFACAIKAKVKKNELPLLTGNFLRNYMQPFSPGKPLDVKKSSFKKFSKFLQAKVKEGYISVKEQSKGVDVITEIDKSHLSLRELEVPDIADEAPSVKTEGAVEEMYTPLTFTDVYCVNAQTQDLFKEAGLSKGDALIVSDVRQIVTDYIKMNNLVHDADKKQVTLDPILAHTVLKPSEGDLDHMSWEQVINRVMGKMQPGVAISSGSGQPTIKKGKLEPIKLQVSMRASQKKVTLVENLEDYGIDARVFSRLVQKTVASSSSIQPSDQKNKGPQVLVQGNQINFVANLLLEKYQIPRRFVTGLENAPKQKKKS